MASKPLMRIAAAAYPLDPFDDFAGYADKISTWVASADADLLVFPEYGGMELAALSGAAEAGDLARSIDAASDNWARAASLHAELARKHQVHILAGSVPIRLDGGKAVNRAHLFGPDGLIGHQDKQIMTRFERETWDIGPGDPLTVFDTALGRIGVLICYDAEFPALSRALIEAGADFLLVPSCTDAAAGHARVRIGAAARALEAQTVVAMAATVGPAPWCPAVDENVGAAAIFGPPDHGLPETGILAETSMNAPGWAVAEVDLNQIAEVRRAGQVLNHAHRREAETRAATVTTTSLALKTAPRPRI